jgi:RHS repeat-associated protein
LGNSGKEEDVEVGLHYFGKRYYSPFMNRWISPDPLRIHGNGGDLNVYGYVGGNPVTLRDPKGLDFGASLIAGFAIGASLELGRQIIRVKTSSLAPSRSRASLAWSAARPNTQWVCTRRPQVAKLSGYMWWRRVRRRERFDCSRSVPVLGHLDRNGTCDVSPRGDPADSVRKRPDSLARGFRPQERATKPLSTIS